MIECWTDQSVAPQRGSIVDISPSGVGLLLKNPVSAGDHVHLALHQGAPEVTGIAARACRVSEVGLCHAGVRFDDPHDAELGRWLAAAASGPDAGASISEMPLAFRLRRDGSDCSKVVPLPDHYGLPISLDTDSLGAITVEPVQGRLCLFLFGSSVGTTQPTLTIWIEVDVQECRPLPPWPDVFAASLTFVNCPTHAREFVQTCRRIYGLADPNGR